MLRQLAEFTLRFRLLGNVNVGTDVTAEVERYIVWPGQANAYMLGPDQLSPEETLGLLACCLGRPYGEVERERLH